MSKTDERTIEKITALMRADESADAPAAAVRWAKNLFRARAAVEPKKSVARKILAVLQMDLSGAKPAFGERSASVSQARQMLFQAGENVVDIRIRQTEKGIDLHGQILGANFANCTVKLGKFETTANEVGEFRFAQIPRGEYDLSLRKDEAEIVVENLQIN